MAYAEFAKERDAYFGVALPTDADFARYTRALFAWLDGLNARIAIKWPSLVREPLSLFSTPKTKTATNERKHDR